MKGLEFARAYYEECGKSMLTDEFAEWMPHLAVGLVGSGSECFGYDDEISRDHDFEPGFIIFLPGEEVVDEQTAFRLQRAYSHLPQEFMGLKRSFLSRSAETVMVRSASVIFTKRNAEAETET